MMVLKKIGMLVIAASMFCGEGVFARHISDNDDQDSRRASKQLRKAIKEEKKANKNAEKKRKKRIKAQNNFKKKTEKKQGKRSGKARSSSSSLPPQDEWRRIDRSNGMSEITRIRYRNVIHRGKIVDAPVGYTQAPIIVPTPLAETTLAYLKTKTAQEPQLSPLVLKEKRKKSIFF